MGKIDYFTHEYMCDKAHIADVFNYYIYQGKEVLRPDNLHEQDTSELILPYGNEGKTAGFERFRDLLKAAAIMKDDQSTTFVLFGIENQSYIHYAAPVKNLLYDAINYGRQVEARASFHKKGADWEDSNEFLGGFRKGDRLYPVVTLVLYWSDGVWDGPMTLHDMIDFGNDDIRRMVADYRLNLLSPSMIDDFGKFRTELGEVLEYVKYSRDKAALQRAVADNDSFKHMDRRSVDLINLVTGSKLQIKEEGGTIDVCKAIEDIREEGIQEGIQKGIEEGMQKGIQEGFRQGMQFGEEQSKKMIADHMLTSIKNLMETMSLTPQRAMDALKVPETDRAGYLSRL